MSKTNNGGPAFPCDRENGPRLDGMTLRDYFAAQAMQTLLAKNDRTRTEIVEDAYGTADAMLKARSS